MKNRLFISLSAFTLGLLVVAVSLASANQVTSYEGTQVSCRKFYFDKEILPDHVFYPFIAAADRALLELSPVPEQIKLRVKLGQKRYDYAQKLLDRGDSALALSTLTKSQKYFQSAAVLAIDHPVDRATRTFLKQQIRANIENSQELAARLQPDQAELISNLNNQTQILLEQLTKQ